MSNSNPDSLAYTFADWEMNVYKDGSQDYTGGSITDLLDEACKLTDEQITLLFCRSRIGDQSSHLAITFSRAVTGLDDIPFLDCKGIDVEIGERSKRVFQSFPPDTLTTALKYGFLRGFRAGLQNGKDVVLTIRKDDEQNLLQGELTYVSERKAGPSTYTITIVTGSAVGTNEKKPADRTA